MKLPILLLAVMFTAITAFADVVPTRWLEGEKGYAKALELQKTLKVPILVWTTQNDCPNCQNITNLLNQPKPKQALKSSIRVIIDQHGKPADAAVCTAKKFSAGYFYTIGLTSEQPTSSTWAWKPNTRNPIDGLDQVLAGYLAEAAKK